MAEFKEVMEQRNYMCHKMDSCNVCPIREKAGPAISCQVFMQDYPAEAEEVITEWYEAHKPCSNLEMLKRVFGNDIPFTLIGCRGIVPVHCNHNCYDCEYTSFWEQEYKGGFKYE